MQLDLTNARFWLDVIEWAAILALAALTWARRLGEQAIKAQKSFEAATQKQHTEFKDLVSAQMSEFELACGRLEEQLKHTATKQELSDLEGTVKANIARTEGITEAISTVRTTLNRIETFLLSQR